MRATFIRISLRIFIGKLSPMLGPPLDFWKYFSYFLDLSMATFKPRETQGTHHVENKMENAASFLGACGGRMKPTRLQSNKACSAVVEKSRRPEPNSADFYTW